MFTLKGASGFRPLFVSAPGAQPYNVGCDTARFEDVDFVLAGSAGFEFYNVRDVAFLRCRCVSTSNAPGVLIRFNCCDDQIVRFSDCFVASARREGALGFEVSPAKVEMSNTIIMTRGNPLSVLAFGSTVRLNRCTIIGGSAMSWATPTNEKERSVPGTAELSRCLLFGPSYIGDHVRWQGKENVYGISEFRESGVVLPGNVKLSFDEWVKSPEKPETGSRLVSTRAKPFEEFLDQNPPVMFGKLKTYLEELRALHPDVGVDPAVADSGLSPLAAASATAKLPDRRIAEWVIERKGTVFVNDSANPISRITDLPPSDFTIRVIRFHSMSLLTGMDADLIPLRALRDLEFIDIDSDVSAAGISGLAHIPTLARFSLWGRELGNDRLAALSQIKSLEKLYLVDAKLTSEQSLTLAKSMPQLNGMSLEENKLLDDEAILPFGTMSKLASLKLNGTKVTAAGVAALQKALPNCKIHWDGDAK